MDKRSDSKAAEISNKLTIELLSFPFFIRDSKFEIPYMDLMKKNK